MARAALIFALFAVNASAYNKGDPLTMVIHVGPVNNPSETYAYYSLPFCGKDGQAVDQDLGESPTGDRKVETPYELKFGQDVEFKEVCVEVRFGTTAQ
jgi:hypothetical protein